LTDAEFEEMKKHTTIGRDVIAATQKNLGNKSFLEIGLDIAYTHHEKWDGSGYPQGLKGTQIPLFGRMMALADTYDALISRRVYKQGYSHEEAVRIITSEARDSFDPSIVSAFLKLAPQFRAIAEKYTDPQSD
jgi:putative two-component system response regulator